MGVFGVVVEAGDQVGQMTDEALCLFLSEPHEKARQSRCVAFSQLVYGGLRRFGEGNHDATPVLLVMVAPHKPGAGQLADDQAGVRRAHVSAPGQVRDGGGPGDPQRDQRRQVSLTVTAAHLEDLRHFPSPSPQCG